MSPLNLAELCAVEFIIWWNYYVITIARLFFKLVLRRDVS